MKTAMDKPFKTMAPLSSIYGVDFKNLAKNHELAVGEDLTGKVVSELADLSYDVQKVHDEAHAAYDLFSSNDVKDIVNVLRDVMTPESHGNVLFSLQQVDL